MSLGQNLWQHFSFSSSLLPLPSIPLCASNFLPFLFLNFLFYSFSSSLVSYLTFFIILALLGYSFAVLVLHSLLLFTIRIPINFVPVSPPFNTFAVLLCFLASATVFVLYLCSLLLLILFLFLLLLLHFHHYLISSTFFLAPYFPI